MSTLTTGGCLSGAVRFTLANAPDSYAACMTEAEVLAMVGVTQPEGAA